MYAAVLSAIFGALGWFVRSVLVKFFVFFGLFFVTVGFVEVLNASGLLPTADSFNNAFNQIPATVWYFLNLCRFNYGVQLIIAAHATRFIIRRIPVIG